MLFELALIPAVILLIYIYKKDTVEKEPTPLLMKCVGFGALATLPAIILELILQAFYIEARDVPTGSLTYAITMGFLVAGATEEACKYFMLRKVTWNDKNFDYMFDGIVYGVYVSLGFAALENIFYVIDGGIVTGVARMFTAIPGHTCFGVYMGYYYSMSKKASLMGNKSDYEKYTRKALIIPMVIHGLYDALIMTSADGIGEGPYALCVIAWIILVIILFRKTFKFVNLASRYDYGFYETGLWKCPKCGFVAKENFCNVCGTPRTHMDIEALSDKN